MTLSVNLDGVRSAYRLCYVRSPWAYFTRLPLDLQWGDRWELSPCGAYAGVPYNDSLEQILKVAFDGPLFTPDQGRDARSLSVLDINRGEAPWLRTESFFGGRPGLCAAGLGRSGNRSRAPRQPSVIHPELHCGSFQPPPSATYRETVSCNRCATPCSHAMRA